MSSIQFSPLFPIPVLLVSAIIGLILLLYFEFKRRTKFLLARMLLQLIVVTALLALALKPASVVLTESHPIILLTDNYEESTVDSLNSVLNQPVVFHHNGVDRYKQSNILSSYDHLQNQTLYVVGSGIPYYDLNRLEVASFYYFPTPIEGIQELLFDIPYSVNRTSWIKGTINTNSADAQLILSGPEGAQDSVVIKKSNLASFSLNFRPKVEGKFIYQLIQKDSSGNILHEENIPIRVFPERTLTILMLQDFPSVETRFLKNFLGMKGHSLALRYGVSKNVSQSEFINKGKEPLDNLTLELINKFDLLIIADATYNNLSRSNQLLIANAVQDGLGVILLLDETPKRSTRELLPVAFEKTESDTIRLKLESAESTFRTIATRPIYSNTIVSVLSNGKHYLEGYVSKGKGRVGFQLLNETYPLLLAEKQNEYAHVWTPLLEAVAREEAVNTQLKLITPFPLRKDEPLEVEVMTEGTNPVRMLDGEVVPLLEDSRLDDRWTGTTWPSHEGWNSISIRDDSLTLDFYISKDGEWASLRSVNQIEANKFYQANPTKHGELPTIEEEISPMLFFMIFLLASGVLWLLPKL